MKRLTVGDLVWGVVAALPLVAVMIYSAIHGTAPEMPAIFAAGMTADGVEQEAHWVWQVLASPAVSNAILWLLAAGLAYIGNRWNGLRRAMQFLELGVRETYETFVRNAKKSSETGKLSEADRKEAVRLAIEKAIGYAKVEGVTLTNYYTEAYLPVLIDAIVRRFKKEAVESTPESPLVPA